MDTKTILSEASDRMQKTIEHLEEELLNIRAGKASPTVLNGVFVDYYGSQTPISGVASVTVPDAKTILIQPWDKNLIRAIEKAIIDSNIGLTPSNNGEQIRLSIPPLTEERRKELVKQVRQEAETARISLRNARRDSVLQEVDFKYFFRFYRGSSGMSKDAPVMKYVEEYEDTSTVRYQPFSIYKAVMENWQIGRAHV